MTRWWIPIVFQILGLTAMVLSAIACSHGRPTISYGRPTINAEKVDKAVRPVCNIHNNGQIVLKVYPDCDVPRGRGEYIIVWYPGGKENPVIIASKKSSNPCMEAMECKENVGPLPPLRKNSGSLVRVWYVRECADRSGEDVAADKCWWQQ